MYYQSASRNHRTKGFKAKQAFKFALLSALCIWLLYQCKNSHGNTKHNRIQIHIKLGHEEHGAVVLGRKGNAAWHSASGENDSNTKDEEETSLKEKAYNRENIISDEEKDTESQNEKPESNRENNPGIALSLSKDLNHGDKRLRVNEERDFNEPQTVEEGRTWTSIPQKDEASKENIEDKDHTEETGNGEIEDGFHRFQDENGVPEDVYHIVESTPRESSADKKSDLYTSRK